MFASIIDNEVKELELNEALACEFFVGVIEQQELNEISPQLEMEEAALEECFYNAVFVRNTIEEYDHFSFGIISTINMFDVNKTRKEVAFILKKNFILFVDMNEDGNDEMEEVIRKALERISKKATPERMVSSILEHMLFKGNEELVFAENIIAALEEQVVDLKHAEDIGSELTDLRSRVATLKNFYDQLIDIGEILQENTNDIFEEKDLRYLKVFTTKAVRMKERSQGMNEDLIHIWELLDANMNNKLNDTMKVLTIVSIIFQPLTMITGWYGMNFKYMPELAWAHGYLFVIILNILIIIAIFAFFKKKKML